MIIPAFNAERWLRDAITSVLAQTCSDFECIIVDDGSTDGTARVAESFDDPRVRMLRKPNRGTVSDARNAGIAAATGNYIALLDADDVWLPTKLERQLELFAARPDLGLVYTAYAITDEHLNEIAVVHPEPGDPPLLGWLLLEANGLSPSSTTLMPRSVVEQVGLFRLELSVSEDAEFAERIAREHPIAGVDECLALYRTHAAQGHLNLAAFEHDVRWIYNDRFGGVEHHDARRLHRRGLANLYTRLFYYALASARPITAMSHLLKALRFGPMRVVALPIEGLRRRHRRRRRRQAELKSDGAARGQRFAIRG